MEYIDRESVIVAVSEAYEPYASTLLAKLFNRISEIPAAKVEPVRHGRWSPSADRRTSKVVCSECFSRSPLRFNYCPDCGAKMDLPEEVT